jgi:hypothetical protein
MNTPGKAIAQTQPEQTPTSVGLVATPAPFAVGNQPGFPPLNQRPFQPTLLHGRMTEMLGIPERPVSTLIGKPAIPGTIT